MHNFAEPVTGFYSSDHVMNVAPAAVVTGLLAALFVAVYNTEPVHILQKHSVLMLQGWAFVMGGILFTFVFHIWTYQIHWNALIILSIAAVVLIGNVIAFPAYMKGISYIGPQKGILFGFAEPASAARDGTGKPEFFAAACIHAIRATIRKLHIKFKTK